MATTSSSTTATRVSVSESSDSDLSSTPSSLPSANPSLIDRLHALQKSVLSGKQVIRKNKPGSHRKKRRFCSTNPTSVTPVSRVHEFPNTIKEESLVPCKYYVKVTSIVFNNVSFIKGSNVESQGLPFFISASIAFMG